MSWLYAPYPLGAGEAFVADPIGVTLVRSTRLPRRAKSSLPQLLPVNPPDNFGGPRVKLVAPRSRNPKTTYRLGPPLPPRSTFVARPVKVTLVRIRPFPTDASVFKPAVINQAQGPQGGIGIQLVQPPRQARKTTSKLFGFIPKVTPPVLYPISVTLAPQRRGLPKSILHPPVKQTALAVPSLVSLFPLLGRVPAVHSRLRPPETPVKAPFAPISVNLTYSRRGKPRSKLSPPAWTRSFGEIKTTFAYQSRGKPKSVLHPPVTPTALAVPALVSLFPLTNRVPAVHSKLSPPATLVAPTVSAVYDPIQGYLVPPRDRRPKTTWALPVVIYDAAIYEPIRGYLTSHDRVAPVRSKLSAPSVVAVTAALYPVGVTLTPSRRGTPKSRLSPPTVVEAAFVYGGPKVRIVRSRRPPRTVTRLSAPTVVTQPSALYAVSVTLAPSRRGKPKSRLLPVPSAFRPVGEVKVALAYSLRGRPKSRLRPPVVVFPFFARPTDITLARIRPVKTHPRLSPPAVVAPVLARKIEVTLAPQRRGTPKSRLYPPVDLVDQQDVGYVRVHLAYSRRGAPKSHLAPPVPPETFRGIQVHLAPSSRGKPKSFFVRTPIAFLAVEIYGPETTLVRIRPPRTMWLLGPMGPPAVVYAPIRTHLAYSRRGAPKSFLPQASLYAPQPKAEYDIKVTLAPQRRGKPKSFLRPPTRVNAATPYFRKLPVTLAPQKRGRPMSFLRPPTVVQYFVARPTLVSLAPSRFPRPKSRLFGYVVAARVFAPISVTLAPSRFPTPKSRLLPPAVVTAAFIQINPTVWLVKITPPPVRSRLSPPAVVGAGVYFRGILTHLAYSVRGKPMYRLSFTAIAVEECYGDPMCGFDFAADVCGADGAATTVGSTAVTDNVSGSDVAATVEGASASSGSVTGDDARREGC